MTRKSKEKKVQLDSNSQVKSIKHHSWPLSYIGNSRRAIKAALKVEMISCAVFDQMQLYPDAGLESHVKAVEKSHNVSRATIFRALHQLGPERAGRMRQISKMSKLLRKRLSLTN
jgi:hypothetical protein